MFVRVRPDVLAVSDTFVYSVPESMQPSVAVGALVRVEMSGRRVNGWITEVDVEPDPTRKYRDLLAVRSAGPPVSVVKLSDWAAWRWAGPPAAFLGAASPHTMVKVSVTNTPVDVEPAEFAKMRIIERAPHEPRAELLLETAAHDNACILFPTFEQAKAGAQFLRDAGNAVLMYPDDWAAIRIRGGVVVGTRSAAWAPLERLDGALVVDAHDHRYVEERAPTWSAVEVLAERCRRNNATLTLVSPCPTVTQAEGHEVERSSRNTEREGWPEAVVVDMRTEDPHKGMWSEPLVKLLKSDARVLCILNRKGRAQLLICDSCRAIAVCEHCGAHVTETDDGLVCPRCLTTRPRVCQNCHAQRLKRHRIGVGRARDELEALIREPVGEITKDSSNGLSARVVIGTEAALFRSQRIDVVAFIDFDQEILAPVIGASERAMSLCARAARLVPPRHKGGVLLVQTHNPDHEVAEALTYGDPERVRMAERKRREVLQLPPFRAVALAEGAGAPSFVESLSEPLEVIGPRNGRYLVRAADHGELSDGLARGVRPHEKLRVVVDPLWY